MAIFEKLSGLAQRAKEHGISKSVIAKDKRLEQSLSTNITQDNVALAHMSTYGMPNLASAIAFDPWTGLLAVSGSSPCFIQVFGKGVSAKIPLPSNTPVKYMHFKMGCPLLIVIDRKNTIITIDLKTKRVHHVVPVEAIVTSYEYCVGTDWLCLGLVDGRVQFFDVELGIFADYQTPNLMLPENQPAAADPTTEKFKSQSIVVCLQIHPTDLHLLLVGYETAVFLWDLRERAVKRVFSFEPGEIEIRLTCVIWSPSGHRFMAGYDDGSLRLWDMRSPRQPLTSRKLLPTSGSTDDNVPIYRLAWYVDTSLDSSYLLVAGGSRDFLGLHSLEFDLEQDGQEAQKQSFICSSNEVDDFIMLSRDAYFLGMRDPYGVLILSCDGSVRGFTFDHSYSSLLLPAPLEMLIPPVLFARHIPMLPEESFRTLTSVVDPHVKYLPLTGGSAGRDHVYRIPSNDLLTTIHVGEIIKFWDASFTALKPLPYLTIDTKAALANTKAHIQCINLNQWTNDFSVGFDNGTIFVYQFHLVENQQHEPAHNDAFLASCDDTLKELGDLLQEMEAPLEDDSQTDELQQNNVAPSADNPLNEPEQSGTANTPEEASDLLHTIHISHIDSPHRAPGYYPKLKIQTDGDSITHLTSYRAHLLAFATTGGKVHVIDLRSSQTLFTIDMKAYIMETKAKQKDELEEVPIDVKIRILKLYNTYSPSSLVRTEISLYIALDSGYVYQKSLTADDEICLVTKSQDMPLNLFIIDAEGGEQKSEYANADDKDDHQQGTNPFETDANLHNESVDAPDCMSLHSRSSQSTKESKKSKGKEPQKQGSVDSIKKKAQPRLQRTLSPLEFHPQPVPHYVVVIYQHLIHVLLSGYNFPLYRFDIRRLDEEPSDETILCSQITTAEGSTCLSLLLATGRIVLLSLPTLKVIAETTLTHPLTRAHESSITPDGRIMTWTAKYELEQDLFLLNNGLPFGNSVILYNKNIQIPPHPASAGTSKQKKSWISTVADAFSKDTMTMAEFDAIMGKQIPAASDPPAHASGRQPPQCDTSESGEPSGSTNVFKELANKMNERGDKLNQLEHKFQDMNQASGDFLKAVRDYNERQARKKWWEF